MYLRENALPVPLIIIERLFPLTHPVWLTTSWMTLEISGSGYHFAVCHLVFVAEATLDWVKCLCEGKLLEENPGLLADRSAAIKILRLIHWFCGE